MKVKQESEKAGLKLNIQKPKIMASSRITLWQIDGEKMETVIDFIFLGSKITVDSDFVQWPSRVQLQHARLLCLALSSRICSDSCPLNRWCLLTISSSVVPFSFCLQSFPVSWSFPMNWLFASHGQSIGAWASASVLPMNIQGWFPLGLTGLISLQSKDSQESSQATQF